MELPGWLAGNYRCSISTSTLRYLTALTIHAFITAIVSTLQLHSQKLFTPAGRYVQTVQKELLKAVFNPPLSSCDWTAWGAVTYDCDVHLCSPVVVTQMKTVVSSQSAPLMLFWTAVLHFTYGTHHKATISLAGAGGWNCGSFTCSDSLTPLKEQRGIAMASWLATSQMI